MSLVPKLTQTSPFLRRTPASDAGLSPVKATTSQVFENPYLSRRYEETWPIWRDDGTKLPSFSFKLGAHAYKEEFITYI